MKKIVLLLLFIVSIISFSAVEGLEQGNIFPNSKLYDVNGKLVTTSDNYQGKITIYNFGASWCPPCKIEKPLLNDFYNKNKDKVNVVSIMVDSTSGPVTKFFKENPIDFPHYFDVGQILSRKFLIRAVPTTYIVDADGIILHRVTGAADWSQLKVEDLKEN